MSSEWTEEAERAESRLRQILCKLSDREFLEALVQVRRMVQAHRTIVIEAMRNQLTHQSLQPIMRAPIDTEKQPDV